jgi:flagellar motility protein MotE (MotC chaperone)
MARQIRPLLQAGIVAGSAVWALSPAISAEQKNQEASKAAEAAAAASDLKQFCVNNAALAASARAAWQTAELARIEREIKRRLAELEAKSAQLAEWMRAHDEAVKKAADAVVAIYSHMKPDAAASLLGAMQDETTAATIITKLPPRTASAILNEMDPVRAAQLTRAMIPPEGKKS